MPFFSFPTVPLRLLLSSSRSHGLFLPSFLGLIQLSHHLLWLPNLPALLLPSSSLVISVNAICMVRNQTARISLELLELAPSPFMPEGKTQPWRQSPPSTLWTPHSCTWLSRTHTRQLWLCFFSRREARKCGDAVTRTGDATVPASANLPTGAAAWPPEWASGISTEKTLVGPSPAWSAPLKLSRA